MFLKLSLLLLLRHCVFGHQLKTTLVDTPVGQINGLVGNDFTMFLGIPYGLVDKKNPFGTAKPYPYFKTPHAAFDDSAICPQYDKGVIIGTIQCLHLNVYSPNVINPEDTLPVMVFIHGGVFAKGNGALSTYSPKFLLRHDVIVVTVNYRLGPYGNLCLKNTEYSNQALKDQNLALKWIKNNIGSFNGDNENIIFFGHSAGSVSVEFHLLYNNDNIFNKVILQSGQAVTPFCNQVTNTATFAKDIGMDAENIDVDRFIETVSAMDTNMIINITKYYDFCPCIDGELIKRTPKMKNLRNIKIMIGGTVKEMLYLYPKADSDFYMNFDFVPELDKGFSVSKMTDGAVDVIKHFYFDNLKDNIVDFLSDITFNYPTERSVNYYVQNNCTVYRYLFSYDGGRNYMKIRENISTAGSTHGDELGYLFDMPLFGNLSDEDRVIIDRISLMWTNFAKYGDPIPMPSLLLPVKWIPVTAGAKPYLQIDTNLGIYNGPFQKRMAFWDLYYSKYGLYAKGISLGEKWQKCYKNKAYNIDLSKILLLISLLTLWK